MPKKARYLAATIFSDKYLCPQDPEGGYAGGPGQVPHLAPTYAAVNALCILGTDSALASVRREPLAAWMDRLRQPDGAFMMHIDGELDIRGVYCALAVARLTNIYSEDLFRGTDRWLLRCQSYEGGFGGVPGMEAHGGYSFCGLAGLMLMGQERLCNLETLALWGANRQMRLEGGFQGRTNKLVDGCYSFWQGGLFPLLHSTLAESPEAAVRAALPPDHWLFDQRALQEYLLICCQDPRGGLLDKPGKSRDFYHTCYTLRYWPGYMMLTDPVCFLSAASPWRRAAGATTACSATRTTVWRTRILSTTSASRPPSGRWRSTQAGRCLWSARRLTSISHGLRPPTAEATPQQRPR
jgi:protein farnesyltransferase subunit beta